VALAFNRDLEFEYGVADRLSPLVRRVIARNASPFTFHGTGTYIVGRGRVAVIDPGPDLPEHVDAQLAALEDGEAVSHIVVTHTHLDHSPAARALKARTGAPTYGFGPHGGGARDAAVEAGADRDFIPDVAVGDGDVIEGEGWTLEAIHTPGHTSNHLCFALPEERALFPGDHVMGWSTTVVVPPDGDMGAYMASLARLEARADRLYYPTHGAPIPEPQAYVAALAAHRRAREDAIARRLAQGIDTVPALVAAIYVRLDPRLRAAAGRTVLAHLIHMAQTGRAATADGGPPGLDSRFRLIGA
jgi:glyoxylase-like metal-dependent hydrolase (beta-lactamase superfamily II)